MAPMFWHWDTVIFQYGSISAVTICLILAIVYVGSLYINASRKYERDHPETIKERFIRVAIVCVFVVPFLWLCSTSSHSVKARPLLTWIGIRFQGCIVAVIIPLILTMILFLGPLSLYYYDGVLTLYKDPQYWSSSLRNLIWLRNHVIAPFSEEFVFRACMLPLLVPAMGESWSISLCPLFFGVAHFHHVHEKIKEGVPAKAALLQCLFQFSYTTIFGAYSAFLFLRTDHLLAPIVAHAFCNHMGFPNFQEIFVHKTPVRYYVMACFVVGLLGWMWLLYPLTEPWIYGNDLYYS